MSEGSTAKVGKYLLIIGLFVVVLVAAFGLPSFGSSCGDWDRADAEDFLEGDRIEEGTDGRSYEYEPGDGDYRKTGPGAFEYVGCSDGSTRSGGTSGSSGSGGLFRGGGPGSGK
ncbi:hypothetical protein ACFQZ2_01095 [Streptomonospora algeriensis]|uniref:DUF4247 domain-containing protein n=1 Tax=Streptomonospora algeriensis TaxID=995084 RepID=A0ABW3BBP7_9ACTN